MTILKENDQMEFKKAKGGFPNSLWETYSSFANTFGGTIVLGIVETKKNVFESAKLTIDEVENLRSEFWSTINNPLKVNINILVSKDVFIDEYDGFPILVIKVRRANRSEKPIYINNNVYNGTYRRNHEGDYHCSKLEIDLMIKDASNQSSDKTCLEEFSISDFNLDSIASYKQILKASNPNHIFLSMSDEKFYLNLGIAKVGLDGKLHPTRAGLLMFGNEYRITDEFNHYFLDYQNYNGPLKYKWDDRIQSSSGDWSGNVFDFFFKVYNKLSQEIATPFKLEGLQRVDDTKMHKAIREALCNCVVNADYYGTRGLTITKYQDKIVFANPGCMRMSIEEALLGGNSDPRNETILKIFSLISIGERAGTGLQTILNTVSEYGYKTPVIEENFNPDRTTMTIYLTSNPIDTTNANDNITLLDIEQKALDFINNQKQIERQDLENYLGCGKTKGIYILKSLLNKGLIRKIGLGKNIKYIIKD